MRDELSEVREYPRDEDPLQVALWRDQTLTLEEHRAVLRALRTPDTRAEAETKLRTARANLQAAEQAVRECEEDLQRFL